MMGRGCGAKAGVLGQALAALPNAFDRFVMSTRNISMRSRSARIVEPNQHILC